METNIVNPRKRGTENSYNIPKCKCLSYGVKLGISTICDEELAFAPKLFALSICSVQYWISSPITVNSNPTSSKWNIFKCHCAIQKADYSDLLAYCDALTMALLYVLKNICSKIRVPVHNFPSRHSSQRPS